MSEIDLHILRKEYSYDPLTGSFRRLIAPKGGMTKLGEVCEIREGYNFVMIREKRYQVHRVVWLYVHGEWPKGQIDHVDGNPLNNSLANLRDVSGSQNQWNTGKRKNNTTGFKGVTRCGGKFRAAIRAHYKRHELGTFDTAELASEAYQKAAQALHGEFARVK